VWGPSAFGLRMTGTILSGVHSASLEAVVGQRASLSREVALSQAPAVSDEGFLVPSPQA